MLENSATPEPAADSAGVAQPQREYLTPYHVVVHNCACHTFDDVIYAFTRVLGVSSQQADRLAFTIDRQGSAIVATVNQEAAEHYALHLQLTSINQQGAMLQVAIVPAT